MVAITLMVSMGCASNADAPAAVTVDQSSTKSYEPTELDGAGDGPQQDTVNEPPQEEVEDPPHAPDGNADEGGMADAPADALSPSDPISVRHPEGMDYTVNIKSPRRVADSRLHPSAAPARTAFFEHTIVIEHNSDFAIPFADYEGGTQGWLYFLLFSTSLLDEMATAAGYAPGSYACTESSDFCILGDYSEVMPRSLPPGRHEFLGLVLPSMPASLPFDALTYCVTTLDSSEVVGCSGYAGGQAHEGALAALQQQMPAHRHVADPTWGAVYIDR